MEKLGRGYDVNDVEIGYNSDSQVLRTMSQSLFLAMLLLALLSLLSVTGFSSGSLYQPISNTDAFMILPKLLRDLVDEGLIKKGSKGFVLGAAAIDIVDDDYEFLKDAGVDLLTGGDQNADAHQVFDFLFVTSFQGIQGVDSILKDTGLVISPLGRDPSDRPRLMLTGYKIVYLRRFERTVVAMRKTEASSSSPKSQAPPCGSVSSEEKRAALKGLEDVYLEPPRRADIAKESSLSRKIKFLPNLLKDSLDEYTRRVFISDESNAIDWFYKNYPMRHQEFEVLNMDVGSSSKGASDWLRKKVRRQDYVVMKAEARVVEEMLEDSTLSLVDELFLECENQWQDEEEEEETGSKRPYWECLALYGKVRDEGIAVHQWWS